MHHHEGGFSSCSRNMTFLTFVSGVCRWLAADHCQGVTNVSCASDTLTMLRKLQ